jgi:nucleotide-binding universal stress UspA family protein
MFKRILVPLDGSENAEQVLPFVVEEAKLHGADIVLLRVIAPLRRSLMSIPSVMDQVYRQVENIATEYMTGVAEKLKAEDLQIEYLVERGRPAERIIQAALDSQCDLIVIGSHGESGSVEWRFGSVANKVIKAKVNIPLMLVTT